MIDDRRLAEPHWSPTAHDDALRRVRWMFFLTVPLAVWYFSWLLHPDRIGNPVLYAVLLGAEAFNLVQALGFWWTCRHIRRREHVPLGSDDTPVDVLIPTCGEPLEVVEPTIAAARRMRGAIARVTVLDDGPTPELEAVARRHGAAYVTRPGRSGAKAGSINRALTQTHAPFVAVFDCDHVPDPAFLERTLGHMADERVAFVQTPQYYANHEETGVAAASWAQQALFFGPIARGKDGLDGIFCCGTNVLFRRSALEETGGFPVDSVTEDFELSIGLHERGWKSVYVPEVLARGLGPADMASYVGQQHRWARGCLGAIGRILRSKLPARARIQYLLSSMFFLSGWTFLVYMSLPVIRLLTGEQPVAAASADQFLLHFAPYFAGSILAVGLVGGGAYTFDGFTLMAANFWVHIHASIRTLFRRPARFVVTPKESGGGRQPRAVAPTLAAVGVLLVTAIVGLVRDRSAGTLNNVAFAMLHVSVLLAGAWPALAGTGRARPATDDAPVTDRPHAYATTPAATA